jgi:activating signal cointegrator complex subunit 2
VKLTGIFDGEPLDTGTKKTPFDPFEKQLVEMFKADPAFFHSSARKSKSRQELCQKLKWTNEQVEGWFIMFNRNTNRDEILDKYDKPENRPIDTQDESRSLPDSSTPSSLLNNTNNRGRGGRGGGGRGKKRGQRVYKPPPE